ncbi:MAG: phosphoenolpyruvate carboxykinase [Bacteroidota bacterium]|jgi:phosphoenolpyruvate carboxykinase (ATP)
MDNFILTKPTLYYQNSVEALVHQTIDLGLGKLADNGALCVNTGKFTGRSPENKFIIKDAITADTVDWGGFNHSMDPKYFIPLRDKMIAYLEEQKEVWVRDAYACAEVAYQLPLRLYTELPWSALFANNMFIRPSTTDLKNFNPEWQIIHAPNFKANPAIDGTAAENFSIISFSEKTILIGGSAYTGEIKKGIFTVLNFILPHQKKVLSMHCSANEGAEGDVALFFGLSGTGKTTLSADPTRKLIGDDEHGWTNHSVFNFEGGCYAKTIHLSAVNEPDIYGAIKAGALLENIVFFEGTDKVDYSDATVTENTRVSYPIEHIHNIVQPSIGAAPTNIFFLTCDAYGVLPPISKLNAAQAMYQFISGYTAKIAGTEEGVKSPKATFSSCFGAPFMPLHPGDYAKLLGAKIESNHCKVWLINTGWSGGAYGVGKRMALSNTRKMIEAVLNQTIDQGGYDIFPVFNFEVPKQIEGVDASLLQPENTWQDKEKYVAARICLAELFERNFKKFEAGVEASIIAAGPTV